MFQKFIEYMNDVNTISTTVRLALALLLGGVLGLERGRKRRPAGLRTYMIVCMASALVMITGEFIVEKYGTGDPARLGAQVISGIGFLGAGTIIITSKHIKGLTTAAGLWASACMGLAVGAGFYAGAIICGIFVLLAMTAMHKVDRFISLRSPNMNFFAEFQSMENLGVFIEKLRQDNMRLNDIEISKDNDPNSSIVGVTFWVHMQVACNHADVIHKLSTYEGVRHLEELEYI